MTTSNDTITILEVNLRPSSRTDTIPVYRSNSSSKHLQIQGSFNQYKAVRDATGATLYKFISYNDRMQIVSASSSKRKYTVRRKELDRSTGYAVVQVWKGENTSTFPWIEIKGDVMNRKYIIAEALPRQVLGYVKKDKGSQKEKVGIYVQPGVDPALVTAIVLGIDRVVRCE